MKHDLDHLDIEEIEEYERRKANGNELCGHCEEGFVFSYDWVPYGSSGARMPVSDICNNCDGMIYLED